jgi:GrpB-like predicted nucleotidyltransferase (UPF0157 family)
MESAGYQLRVWEPEFHEHRMFRTPSKDGHGHFYSPTSDEISRCLTFRDRLRSHPDARRLYEDVKRSLATQDWANMNEYAEAKSAIVEQILAEAHKAGEITR